jgi:LysR family hydrogen peroxide-inducible transcriptional activator
MVSIKQLNYALAVEKTLHFKKAADLCYVSPSTLSNALAELETQLGVQVFERTNKKVLITTAGREVLNIALSIKLKMDDLNRLSKIQNEPLSYPITIGIIPTIGPYLLPVVLPSLTRLYPNLKLTIVEDQSINLVNQVKRGDIDTAIIALPFDLKNLNVYKFWSENFYWMAHVNDPLAHKTKVTGNDLTKSKLMLLSDGHCLKDQALDVCKIATDAPYSVGASSLTTLIQLVAGKMGTTLVPHMAVDQLLMSNPLLTKALLDEPGPHREIAFILRSTFAGINDIELLKNLFKKELELAFNINE